MPRVAVILPIHNAQRYVLSAIQSILSQTFTDFVLFCIDDASTDGTADILSSIDDKRVRLHRNQENRGIVYCLNTAISSVDCEYVARMDADDISLENRFRRQISFLEDNSTFAGCGTWFKLIDGEGNISGQINTPVGEKLRYTIWIPPAISHPSLMIRHRVAVNYPYDPSSLGAEDYDLFIRISRSHLLTNIPEALFHYRIHENSFGIARKQHQQEVTFAVFNKHFPGVCLDQQSLYKILALEPSIKGLALAAFFLRMRKFIPIPSLYIAETFYRLCLKKIRSASGRPSATDHGPL